MSEEVKGGIVLSSKTYDKLKPVVQLVLPALGAAYFGLAQIWGLPKAEEIVGSIAIVTTFLGVILGLSSRVYNTSDAKFDGVLNVIQGDASKIHQLDITTDPHKIQEQKQIVLKVNEVQQPQLEAWKEEDLQSEDPLNR